MGDQDPKRRVHFGAVNCGVEKVLCHRFNDKQDVFLTMFQHGRLAEMYSGAIQLDPMRTFIKDRIAKLPEWNSQGKMVHLDSATFNTTIDDGPWIIVCCLNREISRS